MSIEAIGEVLREVGVTTAEITAEVRLRADLALDSVETSELELELAHRFGLKIDLWDATDYSLGELAALIAPPERGSPAEQGTQAGQGTHAEQGTAADRTKESGPPSGIPRVPDDRARRYREAGWWRPETLDAVLLRHARGRPGACALVAGERRVGYGELAATVDRVADRLRTLGVRPGDPVVVQLPNSIEYVVLMLALMRIGAPPVLTGSTLREYELDRILRLTRPQAVAVPGRTRRSDHLSMIRELRDRHPYLTRIFVAGGTGADGPDEEGPDVTDLVRLCEIIGAETGTGTETETETGTETRAGTASGDGARSGGGADPAGAALMLLSSGTTGPSKVIVRTHEDYGYVVRSTSDVAGISADTVYLAVMPATHTFVLAYPGVMGTLAAGGTVVLGGAEDPRRVLDLIQRERVTHVAAVPGLVTQWLGVLRTESYDLSSLRVLQVGGARLDPALAGRARRALPCAIQQVYGMSEGLANFTRLDDPDEVALATQGRPASPGDEIMIVDEDERPVPEGEVGQLLTRGPSTVAGYYRDDEATARAFTQEGFYRTGDLVRRRPDGNLEIAGRIKNLINRGGEKICAEELEELVRQMPGVAAAGVAPMPHPVYGEIVCLFAVPSGDTPPGLRDIRRHLESCGLARYKLPERLEIIDELPLIGVGKLDRGALRDRVTSLTKADAGSPTG